MVLLKRGHMPKTLSVSINLGKDLSGKTLLAQVIKSNGESITSLISDGFYEVGSGYYIWEYSNFPEDFRGGIKFYEESDTSKVLYFSEISIESSFCSYSSESFSEIEPTFDITYNDQTGYTFYAILFSAQDLSNAWNKESLTFEKYILENQQSFVLPLSEDTERVGWYFYQINNTVNIPAIIGNQYYFIEVWQQKGNTPNRSSDLNTGSLKVYWGRKSGEWVDIARKVWEFGTRTLTDFNGITPNQIWEYSSRTLTSECNYSELEKNIINAIALSTGKTIQELGEVSASVEQTLNLLRDCCSSSPKGSPNIQTPKIGSKGSFSGNSNIKFT